MIGTRTLDKLCPIALLVLLSGCGGSGDQDDPPPNDPVVTVDIADATVMEGNNGTRDLVFPVTLSAAPTENVTVDYASSDGSATAGSDYVAVDGTLTILAGLTSVSIVVSVNGDAVEEADETLILALSNPSRGLNLGTSSATGTIQNDDMPPPPVTGNALNDTGVVECSTASAIGLDCNDPGDGTDVYPAQDAQRGRDASNNDNSDGRAGFAFTKLDASGVPLADQSVDYDNTPWSCVRDEVTGLTWEVKTNDGGLQDSSWTYSWYSTRGVRDGGVTGEENNGVCIDDATCDTEKFLQALNDTSLCGQGDWRLPTRGELLSIVDFGAAALPYIDAGYFPNTVSRTDYWTATTAYSASVKRTINFNSGFSNSVPIGDFNAVRAVRDWR